MRQCAKQQWYTTANGSTTQALNSGRFKSFHCVLYCDNSNQHSHICVGTNDSMRNGRDPLLESAAENERYTTCLYCRHYLLTFDDKLLECFHCLRPFFLQSRKIFYIKRSTGANKGWDKKRETMLNQCKHIFMRTRQNHIKVSTKIQTKS